jgi:hypothetical protein
MPSSGRHILAIVMLTLLERIMDYQYLYSVAVEWRVNHRSDLGMVSG